MVGFSIDPRLPMARPSISLDDKAPLFPFEVWGGGFLVSDSRLHKRERGLGDVFLNEV